MRTTNTVENHSYSPLYLPSAHKKIKLVRNPREFSFAVLQAGCVCFPRRGLGAACGLWRGLSLPDENKEEVSADNSSYELQDRGTERRVAVPC